MQANSDSAGTLGRRDPTNSILCHLEFIVMTTKESEIDDWAQITMTRWMWQMQK